MSLFRESHGQPEKMPKNEMLGLPITLGHSFSPAVFNTRRLFAASHA